ncbi:hypothetical protein ACFDR9_004827 [Janthinobacterium sp. CG_23.3]|uniref:hypothetical protein n=1 Tax=Janthinobacterium sp. CG_23.3 TaxID=3349634 RepID=UPI0038D4CF2F
MPRTPAAKDTFTLNTVATPRVAAARLAVGLLQGALLYLLYLAKADQLWPATQPYLFAPLVLLGVLSPVLLISSLGHLAPRRAAAWMLAAALVVAALAPYDIWRLDGAPAWRDDAGAGARVDPMPSTLLFVFCGVGLYIAHALVLAGALERRLVARYPSYFDAAWKLAIQLLFSAFFVGALWPVGADVARTVAVSARVAAMLLLPIWANGVYALGLRVNDYGWSSERIIGAACLLVVGCYAMRRLGPVRRRPRSLRGRN